MNISEALNIFGLSGSITEQEVKKTYRRLAIKYHPDKNPAGASMMQMINSAFDFLKTNMAKVNGYSHDESEAYDYGDAVNDMLNKLFNLHADGLIVEVCGNWIWVSGNTKQYSAQLGRKEGGIGFFWSKNKSAWYYRPDEYKSSNRGRAFSLDEIREHHGSEKVKASNNNKKTLAA